MSTANTSRVFETARLAKARLKEQSWPAGPHGKPPTVAFADVSYAEHAEIVHIIPSIGDDSGIVWRSMPKGRDEAFDLLIHVTSDVGYTDEDDAIDRLEELCNIVQRAFYDDETATFVALDGAESLDGVSQVSFDIAPSAVAPGNWAGSASIFYSCRFRI